MWSRKKNRLLAPLAQAIGGTVADGELTGSYGGYQVKARPHSGYPIKYISQNATQPAQVNMLQVTLLGVAGSQTWHCQSSASSYLQDLASRFTAGPLLQHFKPGQFEFEGVDRLSDSMEGMGEKLTSLLRMPLKANADPALQERLVAAGLFAELDALRLGAHPYLPRLGFIPGVREIAGQVHMLDRLQPQIEERLRAAGLPDFQSLVEAKLQQAEEESPGRLSLDVEAEKSGALSPAQFREVLERLMRIALLNAEVNQD